MQTTAAQKQKPSFGGGEDERFLLSLDGGGVRSLSTLYILKRLMDRLNYQHSSNNRPQVKPCEIFDLIGGSSTGGLIAIMLGRLEMDVDQCIRAYQELMQTVFAAESVIFQDPYDKSKAKPQFSIERLQQAFTKIIRQSGRREDELFNDEAPRGCNVFVCTTAGETSGIIRLRNYTHEYDMDLGMTILQAALATSAATTFFESVTIGDRTFFDGGLSVSNPVDIVEAEASDIWCPDTADLKPLVQCFISIGAGYPGINPVDDSLEAFYLRTIDRVLEESKNIAEQSLGRWRGHFDKKQYFRFNVEHGLEKVGLNEVQQAGIVRAATQNYLIDQRQRFQVRDCVIKLKEKERVCLEDFL